MFAEAAPPIESIFRNSTGLPVLTSIAARTLPAVRWITATGPPIWHVAEAAPERRLPGMTVQNRDREGGCYR